MSEAIQEGLHGGDKECVEVYDDICTHYTEKLESEKARSRGGEVGQFLKNYVQEVHCLLDLIRACDLACYGR